MVNCKICDELDVETIFETNLHCNFIKNMSNVNISCCKKCGFCFNSKITQSDCNDYYENTNTYTHHLYDNKMILQHDRYKHLKQTLTEMNIYENDEIIDLTSSDGSLLNYLKHLGYNNLTYCDISQQNLDKISIYNNTFKLNVMDINDYKKINKKYKVIFFNHTLEHIYDVNIFFENVKILMNDESILYIEVPDINRIISDKISFLELTYEHINFFNKESLNNLCKKNGLNNIKNGILDFKYRISLEIKAVYGLYKLEKIQKVNEFIYNDSTKEILFKYIKKSYEHSNNIYERLDKTKIYSIYGTGVYALFFLSFYKDLKINKIYDDIKTGMINKIEIANINDCSESENILILTPNYYHLLYNNLIEKNIKANIIDLPLD